MPYGATQGIQGGFPSQNANAILPDIMWMAINYFPNRAPLLANLAKKPSGNLSFYMNNDTFRPRTTTLAGAYTSTGTTLTVADSTGIDVGDVLEIDSERMVVSAVNNANTITVSFAFEGTTNANHANAATVTIVTSAATGAEVDKDAMSRLPTQVLQYMQTVQKAYQIGGALESTTAYMDGAVTPLQRDKMMAFQHAVDDFERACYIGVGAALSASNTRQTMKGLKTLLTTNNVTNATNKTAYKPSDFTRDVLQSCFNSGGQPDLILVSPGFLTGLSTWGYTLQQVPVGATELGIQPNVFTVPFLGGIPIVPAPLLGTSASFNAIAINTGEVSLKIKRRLEDLPRGRRGDATEGDFIMEGAIDVENESHHSWTSDITGFAVQS